MIRKLWVQITVTFLVLLSALLLVLGVFVSEKMKSIYYEGKEEQLIETANVARNTLYFLDMPFESAQLNEIVHSLAESLHARITIINQEGNVLVDTAEKPDKMENHKDRPEIKDVLQGKKERGLAVRYSETIQNEYMYVAIPLHDVSGEIVGVLRTSLSLEEIDEKITNLWRNIFLFLLTIFIIASFVGVRLAKTLSKPIEEMIDVSKQLNQNNYNARVRSKPRGQLGELAHAINTLAANLKFQLDKVAENEQQLSGVMENMASGVLLIDQQGTILLANPAIADILDATVDDLIQKHVKEVARNSDLIQLVEECYESKKQVRKDIHFYFPNTRIIDAHLAPYVHRNGQFKGIIAVLHDVTEVRRLERMRSEFVANVSHELKTPVTSVKGFAETLLDGAIDDPEAARDFLEIIYKESERLDRLIKDLLYLSQIEHQQLPLQVVKFNLNSVVHNVMEALKNQIENKKQQIDIVNKGVVWLEGDRDKIEQIIMNLLSNAISYTPEAGKITMKLWEEKEKVYFQISDTGIGISQKDIPRIFERFYRVDKARSRSSGGTGLGLAIVKHLIESHRGMITVDSMEGVGTTFTVTLPKTQPSASKQ